MDRLEPELLRKDPLAADAQARIFAALHRELPAAPSKHRWKFELLAVVAASLLLTTAMAVALLSSGNASPEVVASRAGVLSMCGLLCAFAAVAAIAPRARRLQGASLAAFGAAAVVLVLVRRQSGEGSSPEWLCTLTHLGVGAVPLAIGLWALRRAAMSPFAALALGVSAGTTGAMVGELACGRDATHVLLFHLSAWAGLIAAGALLTRVLRARSHAP